MKKPCVAVLLVVGLTLVACAPSAEDVARELRSQEREAEREQAKMDRIVDDWAEDVGQERQDREQREREEGLPEFRDWLDNQPDEWATSFCTDVMRAYDANDPDQLVEAVHEHGIETDPYDLELAVEIGEVIGEYCSTM